MMPEKGNYKSKVLAWGRGRWGLALERDRDRRRSLAAGE